MTTHEDASTRWGPASSRSWRPADLTRRAQRLPAPESEAIHLNASAAPAPGLDARDVTVPCRGTVCHSAKPTYPPNLSGRLAASAADQRAVPKHLPRFCSGHTVPRHSMMGTRVRAGAAEAFMWNADYAGADYYSRRREHAVGTSQLTELAASGPQAARAAASGTGIGGDPRERLRRTRVCSRAPATICRYLPAAVSPLSLVKMDVSKITPI